jgi:peptide deformylase
MEIVLPPLKIVKYPHPSLRHKARLMTGIDARVRRIAEEMLELMYAHRGLGLAAPQVGVPFQMFVCNYAGGRENKDTEAVYLNPVITERQGSVEAEEGCLSFPGLFQRVRRAKTVKALAYNLKGELLEVEVSDLAARIWQHETDHLHGDLYIDKFSEEGKLASRTSLEELEREYRDAQQKGEAPPDPEIERQLTELEKLA